MCRPLCIFLICIWLNGCSRAEVLTGQWNQEKDISAAGDLEVPPDSSEPFAITIGSSGEKVFMTMSIGHFGREFAAKVDFFDPKGKVYDPCRCSYIQNGRWVGSRATFELSLKNCTEIEQVDLIFFDLTLVDDQHLDGTWRLGADGKPNRIELVKIGNYVSKDERQCDYKFDL